ncbi:MAG: hypothetical protein WDA42_04235 [Candidatus Bathyarchaeia archaeon]
MLKKHTTNTCPNCNKLFFTRNYNYQVCCTQQCAADYKAKKLFQTITETGVFYPKDDTPKNSRFVRKYLIQKYGNKCMICNQSGDDWCGKPITLIIDHINGDSRDWQIDNIQMICPNCDSQLSTYKGRNKGKSTRKYTITQK